MKTSRRRFLACSGLSVGGWSLFPGLLHSAETKTQQTYKAAIIGRTGGGDFGHGYDQVFTGIAGVSVEAIADHDPAGLKKAAARSGAARQYLDYREMLRKEKPDLVCVASRQPDCHVEMCLAAAEVCRGLFVEKPMTETPAEADAILAAANKRGVKIQVAHGRRYNPDFIRARALLGEGLIGQVRQLHIYGKQDSRSGGEDLLVLGTHDFDLMRFYFGDPLWCQASVTQEGHDITSRDVHKGKEPVLVAGDTIHAHFWFPGEIMVEWSSVRRGDHWNTNFSKLEKGAFEIMGTKGILGYQPGLEFLWLDSPFLTQRDPAVAWKSLPEPTRMEWPEHARNPIRSLIRAIETDSQPVCSGLDGRWAVEMVAAVYESQRVRGRVTFPLRERTHPLSRL